MERILTKIQRIVMALKYYKFEIVDENDSVSWHRCERVETRYKEWCTALIPAKKMAKQVRLSAATTDNPIEECSALMGDEELWSAVRDMFARAELTAPLPREDSRVVVGALMALLTYRNWQRPGICQGATLKEFQGATKETRGDKTTYIIQVVTHKTAVTSGPANMTMTTEDYQMLKRYVKVVRPILDPTGVATHLFLELAGKPVTNFSNATTVLTKRYGRKVPTPTSVRKAGAIVAAKTLSHGELSVVARQMGHSLSTSSQYYQAVVGANQATQAFQLRRSLMPEETAEDKSSPEEQQSQASSPKPSTPPKPEGKSSPEQQSQASSHKPSTQAKRKRVRYTKEEEAEIRAHFFAHIQSGSTPTIKQCEAFCGISGTATPRFFWHG